MKFGSIASPFLFIAIIFLGSANLALFTPHEIHLAQEFKTSILAIDFIMFLSLVISALFLPLWGYLCDKAARGGRKNLLLAGTALWSISSFIIYFSPSYFLLLVARIIAGIGILLNYPVGLSMVADYALPRSRGKVLAIIPIAMALGSGAGIVLANVFGEAAWRPAFLSIGTAGLFILALSSLFLREPERGATEPELRELILEGKTYSHRINLRKLLKNLSIGTNRWIIFSAIPWAIPLGIYSYKFMPYLELCGFGPGVKTLLTLFIGSGAVFGYFLGGALGDWASRINAGRILISVLSLFLAVIFLSTALLIPRTDALWAVNTIIFLLLAFLGAILVYVNVPNVHAMLTNVNEPEARGMISSIRYFLGFLAMGTGVLIGGIMVEATLASYRGVLFWGTLVWLLTVLAWLPIFRTIKEDREKLREIMAQRAKEMA